MSEKLYPVTIITTRYQGCYEGGAYAAFYADPDQIPEEAISDDITCAEFWCDNRDRIGVGETPNKALEDLNAKFKRGDIPLWRTINLTFSEASVLRVRLGSMIRNTHGYFTKREIDALRSILNQIDPKDWGPSYE